MYEPSYIIINSMLDLPKFDKTLPIFSDTETDDLYGPLRMIQFYQPQTDDKVYIVDIAPIGFSEDKYQDELFLIKEFIMEHWTIWFNASYDLGVLNISPSMGVQSPDEVTMDTKYEHKVDDLLYLVKMAYPEFMEFGLKKIVQKVNSTRGMYEGIPTTDVVKGFIKGAYISKSAYKYGALDVIALAKLWDEKKIQLQRENLAYIVDMKSQAYALVYQQNGLLLDRKMWAEKLEYAEEQVVKYTALLPYGLNPNSYKQVRAYLETDKSDHEALVNYAASDKPKAKSAEYIINLKKYKKQVSYLKSIEFDRMFTKFNVYGTISGRFSASGGCLKDHFNAQQIPREFQKLFSQDTEDTTVIGLDYSTLELRIACSIFDGKHMYKQLKDGRDLHTEMAMLTTGKSFPPKDYPNLDDKGLVNTWDECEYLSAKDRHNAKGINFGYVFGMSAKSFIPYAFTGYGIVVTLEESEKLRNKYFSLYPEFAQHHSYIWSNYKKPGFTVRTALGRRIKPKLGTDGINIPVQGTGAETTKLAAHYMISENPLVLKYMFNVVHDAIYTRVPKDKAEYYRELQSRCMLKGWTEISKCNIMKYKDIPMMVD